MNSQAYAVFAENGPITAVEIEVPSPSAHGVVLRVTNVGVCHSDTHIREGGYNLGNGTLLRLADRGINFPIVMGHETVGEVVAIGDAVTSCAIGDTRLVYPWIGCGECSHCLAGHDPLCADQRAIGVSRPGGYAELVSVPHEKFVLDFGDIDPGWAATLACSGLTAYSATSKVLQHVSPSQPIVVIGAGGVGLTAIATLKARGHQNICAVDVKESNLEAARRVGASSTVLTSGDQAAADILNTIGEPASGVIDFVGSTPTSNTAVSVLAKGGRLVLVGLFGGELVLPTVLVTIKILSILGSYLGDLQDLKDILELAVSGRLPKIPIENGHLDPQSISDSLSRLVAGGVQGRIVLSPDVI
ncbi:alcohol dehydrogenase [soil metagenome]